MNKIFSAVLILLFIVLQSNSLFSQSLPSVSTSAVYGITQTTAIGGGEILNNGGAAIIASGMVWSSSANPTINANDGLTTDATVLGEFNSNLYGLSAGTAYFVRAYATNSVGTSYGDEIEFLTIIPANCGVITDARDGKTYNTVLIGSQCWMSENLKYLPSVTGSNSGWNSTEPKYSVASYNSSANSVVDATANSNYLNYGVLYNWEAASISCPQGWHLPAKSEWAILLDYLSSEYEIANIDNQAGVGNALKSCRQDDSPLELGCNTSSHPRWNSNLNYFGTNAVGFSALPGGLRTESGSFSPSGYYGYWWSSTESDILNVYGINLSYTKGNIINLTSKKENGYSVRCVRDPEPTSVVPTVNTLAVTEIAQISVKVSANVSDNGGSDVVDRGFVYGLIPNPSISSNLGTYQCGYGTGEFTQIIDALEINTTYYVRSYAKNFVGVAYGDEVSFVTIDFPNCGVITDARDENTYSTVLIGSQCWMAENLKYLPEVTGVSTNWTSTDPRYSVNGYLSADNSIVDAMATDNYNNYGVLYNWYAALTACPEGWHLPSLLEWNILIDYLDYEHDIQNINSLNGAGNTLKSCRQVENPFSCNCNTSEEPMWEKSYNNNFGTNRIGFNALPAGYFGTNSSVGSLALFWMSDEQLVNPARANNAVFRYNSGNVEFNPVPLAEKTIGQSVRCVRNNSTAAILPSINTTPVNQTSITSIQSGGNITSDGGSPVISRGVVYDTLPMPTIDVNIGVSKPVVTVGCSEYVSQISSLSQNTTYYIRAFATNSVGTSYGEQLVFSTSEFPNCGIITDSRDGRNYKTVDIGEQCWMAENLKYLPEVTGPSASWNSTSPRYAVYNYTNALNSINDASATIEFENYGALYNFQAAITACPAGWHLPANAEWTVLLDYLLHEHNIPNTNVLNGAADALKSCRQYLSPIGCGCAVSEHPRWDSNNMYGKDLFGFSAIPSGDRHESGFFSGVGGYAKYWTSFESNSTTALSKILYSYFGYVSDWNDSKGMGYSVRCIKDSDLSAVLPVFNIVTITDVTQSSAKVTSGISFNGGAVILAKGFVYGVNPNPTLQDNLGFTSNGIGSYDFTFNLSGLNENTEYYARAYATNSVGTSYSEGISFVTSEFPNCGTLTDTRDGKIYKTVNIGEQCWMAENLKYLPYVVGPDAQWASTSLTYGVYNYTSTANSTINAMSTVNYANYGVLYNWNAAQTACPEGWHLPNQSEWNPIVNYLNNTYGITNNDLLNGTGNALKSCRQTNSPLACECNKSVQPVWGENTLHYGTNKVGFSGLPGGYRKATGSFAALGGFANFWTSTESSTTNSVETQLRNNSGLIEYISVDKRIGNSIRCVKNYDQSATIPTVVTTPITEFDKVSAVLGLSLVSNGGSAIISIGLVYSDSPNPSIETNLGRIDYVAGNTIYESNLRFLSAGTTYFVRAFATNLLGISYGEEIVFETDEFLSCGLLNDNRDGNTYKTVLIGQQCWMAENLKYLPEVTGPSSQWNNFEPCYGVYGYLSSNNSVEDAKATVNYQNYGVLYNFIAASPNSINSNLNPSGVKGICPTGWHLPSEAEWKELEMSIGMSEAETNIIGTNIRGTNEGSQLAGKYSMWNPVPLTNDSGFGSSGFNALPGGSRTNSGNYISIGDAGNWFTCTQRSPDNYYYRNIYSSSSKSNLKNLIFAKDAFSVRCLKNNELVAELPELTTREVSYFNSIYTISGGIITSDGDMEIMAKGVVWDVVQNPTIEQNQGFTNDGISTGQYSSTITGLVQGTIYYIRAYATNSVGTAYGNEIVFYTDFCSPMSVQIISSSPQPDINGFVNLCWDFTNNQSMEVNLEAIGTYPESGYPLGDENVIFKWDFDDGSPIIEGMGLTSVSHVFTERAGYNVTLIIEDTASCQSNNNEFKKVRIPLLSNWVAEETTVVPNIINPGEPVQICAGYTSAEWEGGVPYQFVSNPDTVQLLDCFGLPNCTEIYINVNLFDGDQLIESADDLTAISMNLVHTSLLDLSMFLECPNGQSVQIGAQGGGGCDLGIPPNEGYWYRITPEATQTMQAAAASLSTLPAGDYLPYGSFSNFVGCPINGIWTLKICDNWSQDIGYAFGWYLDFDESLFPEQWGYTNTYISSWTGNYGVQIDNPESLHCSSATYLTTETPTVTSVQPFVFAITDDFGCVHDTTLYVTVNGIDESELPVLVTNEITSVEYFTALSGGIISANGSSEIVSRGVVWNTSENTTIVTNLGLTVDGSGLGNFESQLTGLLPGTTYFVCAYATNQMGTSYGQQELFTTSELPSVTCPESIVVCEDNAENIVLNGAYPEGGTFTFNGEIITDFNPLVAGIGVHEIIYSYDFDLGFETTCMFTISVLASPHLVDYIQNPESGILPLGTFGEISVIESEIGAVYWLSQGNVIISEEIAGNGDLLLLGDDFPEGTYSIWSSTDNSCDVFQGTVSFAENTGTNKIIAFVTHGNPPKSFPVGHARLTLYRISIDDENNSFVENVEDQVLNSQGQVEFNNLLVGEYYLGSTLLFPEQYDVAPHVFYQSALLYEDAVIITIDEGTVYLANVKYDDVETLNGSNSGHGMVGTIDNEENLTPIQDMVVVLKNVDENEILNVSVTNIEGQYNFTNIPAYTNIQIFVTSLEHQTWIPYELLTGDGDDYLVDFIVNGDLVYPDIWSGVSNSFVENLNFEIYPNPSSNVLYFSDIPKNSKLKIFDIKGSMIIDIVINNQHEINVSEFVPGTYIFIVLTENGQTGIKKFVKE